LDQAGYPGPEYLPDVDTMEFLENLLTKNCQPYLRAIKGTNELLFRGTAQIFSLAQITPRENRNPKDTPLKYHVIEQDAIQDIVDTYQKTNLKAAIDNQNEVMLNCDSYYLLSLNYSLELHNFLKYKDKL